MVKTFSITATLLRAALCAQAPTWSVRYAHQAWCSWGTSNLEHSSYKTHGSTYSTQEQLLPHCQMLGNHNEPLPYPQTAPGQSLKAANQATSGKPRHAVVQHTFTERQLLQQKTLNWASLDSCDSLPLCFTELACLPEVERQSGQEQDECAHSPCKLQRSSSLPMCPMHSCYTF